jgi:CRISPR/Cas system-associated endonuclease Cas1
MVMVTSRLIMINSEQMINSEEMIIVSAIYTEVSFTHTCLQYISRDKIFLLFTTKNYSIQGDVVSRHTMCIQ